MLIAVRYCSYPLFSNYEEGDDLMGLKKELPFRQMVEEGKKPALGSRPETVDFKTVQCYNSVITLQVIGGAIWVSVMI